MQLVGSWDSWTKKYEMAKDGSNFVLSIDLVRSILRRSILPRSQTGR